MSSEQHFVGINGMRINRLLLTIAVALAICAFCHAQTYECCYQYYADCSSDGCVPSGGSCPISGTHYNAERRAGFPVGLCIYWSSGTCSEDNVLSCITNDYWLNEFETCNEDTVVCGTLSFVNGCVASCD
jgi:hypothetical protein